MVGGLTAISTKSLAAKGVKHAVGAECARALPASVQDCSRFTRHANAPPIVADGSNTKTFSASRIVGMTFYMKAHVGMLLTLLSISLCYVDEAYPTLKIGDETYKNVRIVKATPLELTLLYDGGGRTIKLQDLPAPLKEKYPYNEAKAADFKKKQAAEQKALAEQQQKRWSQDAASVRASRQTRAASARNEAAAEGYHHANSDRERRR